ncbi:MAG: hypothetical protein EHM28_08550 [Spirochaetaceae bacterium]|nr:MAG: hypothetical protein EHM28_08550 [Spirochaetaceae bacterium]
MDRKSQLQLKALLLSHQRGTDPGAYISKLARFSILRPAEATGTFPPAGRFVPDKTYCKVASSTAKKPIIPWWWYLKQKEPVPSVAEDIFKNVAFDHVIVYPKKNIWIYLIVEPKKPVLELLKNQDTLRAFIIMSIINKNFNPRERDTHRVRLGKMITSNEAKKILTFVVYAEDYKLAASIPKGVPTVKHKVDTNGTNWAISYPGQKQVFWSFTELVDTVF